MELGRLQPRLTADRRHHQFWPTVPLVSSLAPRERPMTSGWNRTPWLDELDSSELSSSVSSRGCGLPRMASPNLSSESDYYTSGVDFCLEADPMFRSTRIQNDTMPSTASKDDRLVELIETTSYQLVQRNGQRIFGGPPPGWKGQAPDKGCEVFVGKVPRDCFEDELVPVFSKVGKIYEMRLMMDFSGSNRGFFFVRYTNREDAKMAVKRLNNHEIRPGKTLGVVNSVDNRKLWISGIPKNRTSEEIKREMDRLTEGVREVILYSSQLDKTKTRGYAFVEYESHRLAALARRKLVPGNIVLLGQQIDKVDWAEPENEVDEEIMSTVRILFVRNLMPETSEIDIKQTFEELGDGCVERVKKTKDYAFVHFATRDAAERALNQAQGLALDGAHIHVTWSKPVDKDLYHQRKHLTQILSRGTPPLNMSSDLGCQLPSLPFYESPLTQLSSNAPPYNHAYYMPSAHPGPPRGAPGTAPPRRLVKMSALASNVPPNNSYNNRFNSLQQQSLIAAIAAQAGYGPYFSQAMTPNLELGGYNTYIDPRYYAGGFFDPQAHMATAMNGSSNSNSSHGGSPNPTGSINHLNEPPQPPMMSNGCGVMNEPQRLINAMSSLSINGGSAGYQ